MEFNFFRFFLPLTFVVVALGWAMFQIGYMSGAKTESEFTTVAVSRLENCNKVLRRN